MLHLHFIRKNEWLRYRVPTCLGFFYLGLLADGTGTVQAAMQRLGWLLLIYAGSGSFVRYYNDLFDIEADRLSRKLNLAAEDPPRVRALRLLLSTALVFLPFLFLRDAGIALGLMFLQHLLYIAYSTPPLRLKTRGLGGVVTDALYGQTLPPLAAVAVATSGATGGSWAVLFSVLALLLFVSGLNNILFHQLEDRRGDRQSGLRTFATVSGPHRVRERAFRGLFPLELTLLLLFVLCWQERSGILVLIPVLIATVILGWPVLEGLLFSARRLKRLPLKAMISLNLIYETILPLSAMAVLSVCRHPLFWLLAAGHLLLFPDTTYIRLEPAFLWLRQVFSSAFWKTEKAFKDIYYHWLLVRYMKLKVAVTETLARLGIKSK